jgi:hypothetical protein
MALNYARDISACPGGDPDMFLQHVHDVYYFLTTDEVFKETVEQDPCEVLGDIIEFPKGRDDG